MQKLFPVEMDSMKINMKMEDIFIEDKVQIIMQSLIMNYGELLQKKQMEHIRLSEMNYCRKMQDLQLQHLIQQVIEVMRIILIVHSYNMVGVVEYMEK